MSAQGICVMIAAYNARATIGRAVASALQQAQVTEVVVSDDGSGDDTAAAARAEDDGTGRLAVLRMPENKGPSAARNAAIAASRAPYLCVLDADDYLLPGRFDRLLGAAPGNWDLLADDIIIVPETAEPVRFSFAEHAPAPQTITADLATFVRANITRPGRPRAEWGFLKPLVKRAFLDRHGLAYDESLRLGEDYALYVRALMAGGRFLITGACGYIAVERGGSMSARHETREHLLMAAFDGRCLAEGSHLSGAERAALAAHHRAALEKYDYRDVLDIKREQGMVRALGALRTRSLGYIARETLRARSERLAARLSGGARRPSASQVRLLIGGPLQGALRCQAAGAPERLVTGPSSSQAGGPHPDGPDSASF